MTDSLIQKIEALAEQVAAREGVVIYDIEFAPGSQGRTLRVFIDKEGGIGIDDCANVSRGLNLLLDVEDPVPGGRYNLEVSSPGLERALKKPWHFEKVQGKKIWVKFSQALESFGVQNKKLKTAKQLSEVLKSTDAEGLRFQLEDEEVMIPFDTIEKAKVLFDFEEGKHHKKEKPKAKR